MSRVASMSPGWGSICGAFCPRFSGFGPGRRFLPGFRCRSRRPAWRPAATPLHWRGDTPRAAVSLAEGGFTRQFGPLFPLGSLFRGFLDPAFLPPGLGRSAGPQAVDPVRSRKEKREPAHPSGTSPGYKGMTISIISAIPET